MKEDATEKQKPFYVGELARADLFLSERRRLSSSFPDVHVWTPSMPSGLLDDNMLAQSVKMNGWIHAPVLRYAHSQMGPYFFFSRDLRQNSASMRRSLLEQLHLLPRKTCALPISSRRYFLQCVPLTAAATAGKRPVTPIRQQTSSAASSRSGFTFAWQYLPFLLRRENVGAILECRSRLHIEARPALMAPVHRGSVNVKRIKKKGKERTLAV